MTITNPYILAAIGTGFTFLMTALGAATIFLIRKEMKQGMQSAFLGFAAGVMIAASVWSLLIPSMEQAKELGMPEWLPAGGGFVLGGLFLLALDKALPHLHPGSDEPEGPKSSLKRTTMLVFAVTLHNIPEGMAVGLSFALSTSAGASTTLAAAIALAIGNRPAEFSGGCRHLLTAVQGGLLACESISLRRIERYRGADCRNRHGCYRRRGHHRHAMAAVLCGRGNDLCGGGGADSGSKSGCALPCRDLRCHDRVSDYDDHGCCLGIKRFLNYRRVLKKKQQKRVALTRFSLYCIRYFLQARRHPRSHT